MNNNLIITVGPATLKNNFLDEINDENYIFRINAAHVPINELEYFINKVRSNFANRKILVDIPGNKLRLQNIKEPIILHNKDRIILGSDNFNFGYGAAPVELSDGITVFRKQNPERSEREKSRVSRYSLE